MKKLLVIALFLSGCSLAGAPAGIGDLKDLSATHCITSEFDLAGPPPSGRIHGTIVPRNPDGSCPSVK